MGFRFRKSVNLGGFRINLSKSGIGYSVGVKGFRVTKTARNTLRTTASAYGTGLSYVEEQSLNPKREKKDNSIDSNETVDYAKNMCNTEELKNTISSFSVSEGLSQVLNRVKRAIILNKLLTYTLIISLLLTLVPNKLQLAAFGVFFISIFIKLYVRLFMKVRLEYSISSDMKNELVERFLPIIKFSLSQFTWNVNINSSVIDKKYASGASSVSVRDDCVFENKPPFPFVSDSVIGTIKTKKDTFVFMPDALFVISGMKVGAFSYSDIKMDYHPIIIIETSKKIPQDTTLKGMRHKYVNSDGSPDRRFSDNPQYPMCLYGEIVISSPLGLNTIFQFSRE